VVAGGHGRVALAKVRALDSLSHRRVGRVVHHAGGHREVSRPGVLGSCRHPVPASTLGPVEVADVDTQLEVDAAGSAMANDRTAVSCADVSYPLRLAGERDEVVRTLMASSQDGHPTRLARRAAAHLQGHGVPRGQPRGGQEHAEPVGPSVPGARRPVGRSGGIVLGLHLGLRGAAAPPVASRPSGVADGPVPTLGARGKPDTDLRYPGGHRGPTVVQVHESAG